MFSVKYQTNQSKKVLAALLALVGIGAGLGLGAWYRRENSPVLKVDFIMDTVVEQTLYGPGAEEAAQAVAEGLRAFEAQVSMHRKDSEIACLNAAAGEDAVALSPAVYELLSRAKDLSLASEGAFDLTIGPLSRLWNVTGEDPHVPAEVDIAEALSLVEAEDLELLPDGSAKLTRKGQQVDLGGIAKGAASDLVRQIAKRYGVEKGYISIGGNMVLLEEKPLGQDFRIGIRDPQGNSSDVLCALSFYGQTMATTGAYERYFVEDGVTYHHVLDPKTGWPAQSDWLSVSVLCADGTLADYLSTTFFVLPKEKLLSCLDREDFLLVAVDREGQVYCSAALEGKLFATSEQLPSDFIYGGCQ